MTFNVPDILLHVHCLPSEKVFPLVSFGNPLNYFHSERGPKGLGEATATPEDEDSAAGTPAAGDFF